MRTYYDDDFREWIIYTSPEEDGAEEGEIELRMRWMNRNDWSQWDFSGDEINGTIKQTFSNNPNQWEVRCNNVVVTAKAVFPNDWREWRITDNNTTLHFKSKWGNNVNQWMLKNEKNGAFEISAIYEGDPRDWEIYDDMKEEISLPMKVAMLFIVIYHSSPK